MKRLTKRFEDGRAYLSVKTKDKGHEGRAEANEKAINRLAELEDKLESGQLVELPCKVGDTVYKPDLGRNRVIVGWIETIHYELTSHQLNYCITADCRDTDKDLPWDKQVLGFVFYPDSDWNVNVFATKEAAEARLKELREKE